MSRTMGGAYGAKGALHKFKQLLYAMSKLQTCELKLADHLVHILAGRGEQIHPTLRQLFGFGLRETAAIADHDTVCERTGEGG